VHAIASKTKVGKNKFILIFVANKLFVGGVAECQQVV
jgi:hypothetical protein